MIGYDVSPRMTHHVTQPSKFIGYQQRWNSSITALKQLDWQRWNSSIGSAGIGLLAALNRWNRPTSSAGTHLLVALEHTYWQRWNRPTGSAGIGLLAALERLYW